MRKTLFLAAVLLGSTALQVSAKKKKQPETAPQQPVQLITANDTLSYAAGMAQTQGLLPYLTQQLKVDTAYLADFVRGYEDAILKSDDPQYAAYVAGTQIAQQVATRMLPAAQADFEGTDHTIEPALFHKGFTAAVVNDNSLYTTAGAQQYFTAVREADRKAKNEAYDRENKAWLEENARKEGVVTLPSGLQYKVLTQGDGAVPKATDKVTVKYEGHLIDGTEFDSSYKRTPQTSSFRCDQVIKGWTEGLTLMPVGSKWELYIPQQLAYGERQAGKIKPLSALIFTVELMGIEAAEEPAQAAPAAEQKAPAKATRPAKTAKKK